MLRSDIQPWFPLPGVGVLLFNGLIFQLCDHTIGFDCTRKNKNVLSTGNTSYFYFTQPVILLYMFTCIFTIYSYITNLHVQRIYI